MLLPGFDDGPCDAACIALLPVPGEDVGQLVLVILGQNPCGRQLLAGVHAHVQRGVLPVGESPVALVDLQRRQSQIHENQVHLPQAQGIQLLVQLIEGGVHRREAVGQTLVAHPASGQI